MADESSGNASLMIPKWVFPSIVVIMLAALAYIIGGVAWAASISSDVKYMRLELTNVSAQLATAADDRYRGSDARRDHAVINARIDEVIRRQNQQGDAMVKLLDAKLDKGDSK